jgi:hypothetical protein
MAFVEKQLLVNVNLSFAICPRGLPVQASEQATSLEEPSFVPHSARKLTLAREKQSPAISRKKNHMFTN